jgi:hypothetical protein
MSVGMSSNGVIVSRIRARSIRDFSVFFARSASERSNIFPENARSSEISMYSWVIGSLSMSESFSSDPPIASERDVLVSSFQISASLYASITFFITDASSSGNRFPHVSIE